MVFSTRFKIHKKHRNYTSIFSIRQFRPIDLPLHNYLIILTAGDTFTFASATSMRRLCKHITCEKIRSVLTILSTFLVFLPFDIITTFGDNLPVPFWQTLLNLNHLINFNRSVNIHSAKVCQFLCIM